MWIVGGRLLIRSHVIYGHTMVQRFTHTSRMLKGERRQASAAIPSRGKEAAYFARDSSGGSPPTRDPRASKRHCDLVIINEISDYNE